MHENYVSETTHWIKQEENNPMMHMHHVKEIKKAQISVVIPARNEEKTVGFVIESSKLACDEVIVVISIKASFTRVWDDLIFILKYNIYCERNKNKEKKVNYNKIIN